MSRQSAELKLDARELSPQSLDNWLAFLDASATVKLLVFRLKIAVPAQGLTLLPIAAQQRGRIRRLTDVLVDLKSSGNKSDERSGQGK